MSYPQCYSKCTCCSRKKQSFAREDCNLFFDGGGNVRRQTFISYGNGTTRWLLARANPIVSGHYGQREPIEAAKSVSFVDDTLTAPHAQRTCKPYANSGLMEHQETRRWSSGAEDDDGKGHHARQGNGPQLERQQDRRERRKLREPCAH